MDSALKEWSWSGAALKDPTASQHCCRKKSFAARAILCFFPDPYLWAAQAAVGFLANPIWKTLKSDRHR